MMTFVGALFSIFLNKSNGFQLSFFQSISIRRWLVWLVWLNWVLSVDILTCCQSTALLDAQPLVTIIALIIQYINHFEYIIQNKALVNRNAFNYWWNCRFERRVIESSDQCLDWIQSFESIASFTAVDSRLESETKLTIVKPIITTFDSLVTYLQ